MIGIADLGLGREMAWPDLGELEREGLLTYIADGEMQVITIDSFTHSGAPVALVRTRTPDGRVIVQEVSVRLVMTIAAAFRGRYGDL